MRRGACSPTCSAAPVRRPDRRRRARPDAARLDRRVRLSDREQRRVVEVTLEAAAGRVPVVAGVASTTTADAVDAGAGVSSGSAPTASWRSSRPISRVKDEQVEAYFHAIADAVDIPVVLYTNPQVPAQRPHARRPSSGLSHASAHPLHQGRLDQYRPAAVDHEPLRRLDPRVRGLGAHPGLRDADRRRRLDGGTGLRDPAAERASSTISAERGRWDEAMALQRKLWRVNEAFARYNLAACIKGGLAAPGLCGRRSAAAAGCVDQRRTPHRRSHARGGCDARRRLSGAMRPARAQCRSSSPSVTASAGSACGTSGWFFSTTTTEP